MDADFLIEASTPEGGAWPTLMPCRGPVLAASCSAAVCWSLTIAGRCSLWILKVSLNSRRTLMEAECVRSVTTCCRDSPKANSSRCASSSTSRWTAQQQLEGFTNVYNVPLRFAGAQQMASEMSCQAQKIALSRPTMRSQTWIGAGHLDRTKLGERITSSILAFKAWCHPVDAV